MHNNTTKMQILTRCGLRSTLTRVLQCSCSAFWMSGWFLLHLPGHDGEQASVQPDGSDVLVMEGWSQSSSRAPRSRTVGLCAGRGSPQLLQAHGSEMTAASASSSQGKLSSWVGLYELWGVEGEWWNKITLKDGWHDSSPNLMPKHLHCFVVAGYGISPKPLLLYYRSRIWKYWKYSSNFFKRWFLSFSVPIILIMFKFSFSDPLSNTIKTSWNVMIDSWMTERVSVRTWTQYRGSAAQ